MPFYLSGHRHEDWAWYPSVFTKEETKKILSWKDKLGMYKGVTGPDLVVRPIRDSNVCFIPAGEEESQWIYEKLAAIVKNLNERFFHLDLTYMEDLQLTEYDASYAGHYGQHNDQKVYVFGGEQRKLSIAIQLADPSEYEGGDLILYPEGFHNPQKVVREHGMLAAFRSHVIHEVTPVTKGTRYSLVSWVCGPELK